MDAYWESSAAYAYVLRLDPASRAWEYLRRNPRYVRDWVHYRRSASHRVAARWGLVALVDPKLDARQVQTAWIIDTPCPITLVSDQSPHAGKASSTAVCFSLWRLEGRKSLYQDGSRIRAVVRSPTHTANLWLGASLGEGDRFAYQIPAAAADLTALAAVTAFRATMPSSIGGGLSLPERPDRADIFHARGLQVLDGLAAGASQRELAIALFGATAVARAWQPDGALRAQVRYLVRRAQALMQGQYRSLIHAEPVDSLRRSAVRMPTRLPVKFDIRTK